MNDKKAETSKRKGAGRPARAAVDSSPAPETRPVPETKPVVDLLTSILNQVHKQVVSASPRALGTEALQAIQLFQEIRSALALQPAPAIVFRVDPSSLPVGGGVVNLTWASNDAQAVLIDQAVGEVTPTAGGTVAVNVTATTTFTATAVNPCGSATVPATVTVAIIQ